MGRKLIDITGKKYNRLTVIEFSHSGNHRSYWKCRCDCGNEIVLRKDTFIHLGKPNQIKSCGCLKKECEQLVKDLFSKELSNKMKELCSVYSKALKDKGE